MMIREAFDRAKWSTAAYPRLSFSTAQVGASREYHLPRVPTRNEHRPASEVDLGRGEGSKHVIFDERELRVVPALILGHGGREEGVWVCE